MRRIIFIGTILSLAALLHFDHAVFGEKRPPLFSLNGVPQAKSADEKSSIGSVRESEITFESSRIHDLSRISFPLFDGKIYDAARTESEFRALDDYTWRGKLADGKFSGDVILTFKNGFVSGLIYSPKSVYEIVPKGQKQILVELDQSLFPECAGDLEGDNTQKNLDAQNAVAGVDSGDRIDVLVVYTTATKNFLGGNTQAQALAQQAIDATNTAYRNSKIRQRVRMVHSEEFVYTESGNSSTDLSNLRNSSVIQALRDLHKADLVAEISEVTGVCGIGYLMGTAVGGNQNNGFTVTARSCAVGNLSFAHELGHNMGSAHNPENGSGGTYPYSFGHWINGSYRTVMSYVDQCSSGCTRNPYFSNPSIVFMNAPTGTELRNNARSIDNTADPISAYRYSGSSLTLNNYNGGEALPRNLARAVTWSSDNLPGSVKIEISRDATTNWTTLIANTPNDGSEIISISGRPTRFGRIRISSISTPHISDSSVFNISIR